MNFLIKKEKLINALKSNFEENFPTNTKKIIENIREVVTMNFEESETNIFSSKFLGDFYYPADKDFPYNTEGEPLMFFFQINLAELPVKIFKYDVGIIQLFINPYNYEDNNDNSKKDFQVIYHKDIITEVDLLKSNFPLFEEDNFYYRIDLSYKRKIIFDIEPFPPSYYSLELKKIIGEEFFNFLNYTHDEQLSQYTNEVLMNFGHTILGFPYDYYNKDPRINYKEDSVLLFQISEEISNNGKSVISINDGNEFQIYVDKKDLENMNFSNIWFNFTD